MGGALSRSHALLLGLSALLLATAGCGPATPQVKGEVYQDQPRPRARVLRLYSQDNRSLTLQDITRRKREGGQGYAGVLMHIFTTWCRPCLQEVKSLNALHAQARHVKVIGVCVEGRGCPRLSDFQRLTHAQYELYIADQSLVRGEGPYHVIPSVPVTYLIDAKGREVIRFDGQIPLTYATKLTAPLAPLPEPDEPEATSR